MQESFSRATRQPLQSDVDLARLGTYFRHRDLVASLRVISRYPLAMSPYLGLN